MHSKIKKSFHVLGLLAAVNILIFGAMPIIVAAQNKAATIPTTQRCSNFYNQFKLTSGANVVASSSLPVYCSANQAILFVFNLGMGLIGVVTVVFLIIGGFFYVTSAGNEEQSEKGKKILINSVIGLVVVILSVVIVRIVSNLLLTGS